jgi:hypothetical protein
MINEFEKGFGIAGYLLSMSLFATLINKNILTIEEALKIIDGSRTYSKDPDLFPGEPNTILSADIALQTAQALLVRITSAKSSA